MPFWKSYEIDDYETLKISEVFMKYKALKHGILNPSRSS